jgi:hypothetical protein
MIWNLIAKLCARPAVANWLIRRAMRTPDMHLPGYMDRLWLFNPYNRDTRRARWAWIPFSIRIHHILRADKGRDHHDHPWNARTCILSDWYDETRLEWVGSDASLRQIEVRRRRQAGDTATIDFGEYHTITAVPPGGVWTLFIMGRYRGNWGFLVEGQKVPYQEYDNA